MYVGPKGGSGGRVKLFTRASPIRKNWFPRDNARTVQDIGISFDMVIETSHEKNPIVFGVRRSKGGVGGEG